MFSFASWRNDICDVCRKDESELEPRLKGIMENGQWVNGFNREDLKKAKEIRAQWDEEITRPCLVLQADMEEIILCEIHLNEIIANKSGL